MGAGVASVTDLKEVWVESSVPFYFAYDELWFGIEKGKIMKFCMPEGRLENKKII